MYIQTFVIQQIKLHCDTTACQSKLLLTSYSTWSNTACTKPIATSLYTHVIIRRGFFFQYSDLRLMVLEPTLEAPLPALREKQQPIRDNSQDWFCVLSCKVFTIGEAHIYVPIGTIDCFKVGNWRHASQSDLCDNQRQWHHFQAMFLWRPSALIWSRYPVTFFFLVILRPRVNSFADNHLIPLSSTYNSVFCHNLLLSN